MGPCESKGLETCEEGDMLRMIDHGKDKECKPKAAEEFFTFFVKYKDRGGRLLVVKTADLRLVPEK